MEQLPSALFKVRLDEGSLVTAHIADRMDRNFVRLLVGDRVRIELSRRIDAGTGGRSGGNYEGASVGQTDLRQVQDRPPSRRGAGDLYQPEAQAEAGLTYLKVRK